MLDKLCHPYNILSTTVLTDSGSVRACVCSEREAEKSIPIATVHS